MNLLETLESLSEFKSAILLAAVEAVGDGAAKLGRKEITMVSYVGLAALLPILLKKNTLGLTNAYWNAITNVTGVAIGYYYGERLNMRQLTGVAMMSAGILLATGAILNEGKK